MKQILGEASQRHGDGRDRPVARALTAVGYGQLFTIDRDAAHLRGVKVELNAATAQ